MIEIAPSILAADLADLTAAARTAEAGGAEMLHVDVMDGHFVPNLTFGPPVAAALARHTSLPLDLHLMVTDPDRLLDAYLDVPAARLAVHWEVTVHLDRTLAHVRSRGALAGVALNPATPVDVLREILPRCDYVLLMSVNPGFSGQRFLPYVLDKAARLHDTIRKRGLATTLEIDGGVDPSNAADCVRSGISTLVAGSAVYGSDDPAGAIQRLRQAASQGNS